MVETGKIDYIEDQDGPIEEAIQSKSGKMILVNWLDNIRMRIDHSNMDLRSVSIWEHILENPNKSLRQLFFDQYKSHCNVVGATCSSIGEKKHKEQTY